MAEVGIHEKIWNCIKQQRQRQHRHERHHHHHQRQYLYQFRRRKDQGRHRHQQQQQHQHQRCQFHSKYTILSLIFILLLLQATFFLYSSSTMSFLFAFETGKGGYDITIDADDNVDANVNVDANADIDADNGNSTNSTIPEKYILPPWKVKAMFKKIIFDGPVKENLLRNNNDKDNNTSTNSSSNSNSSSSSNVMNFDDDKYYGAEDEDDDDYYDEYKIANANTTLNTNVNTTAANSTHGNDHQHMHKHKHKKHKHKNNHKNNHKQKMVILAGPHNTGTSTIQQALWKWSTFNNTLNYTRPILHDWVWTAPLPIVHAEYAELEDAFWDPSMLHYALLEAVRIYVVHVRKRVEGTLDGWYPSLSVPVRLSFQKYGLERFLMLFQEEMEYHWKRGYNMLLGTEAFTNIVTYPELGVDLLDTFRKNVLPPSNVIDDSDVTVVILYSKPKVQHFMKTWIYNHKGITFHDWILFGKAGMYSTIDALGMVQLIYEHTDWNIALVDVKGVEENNWYMPNYIACHVMNDYTNYDHATSAIVSAGDAATGGTATATATATGGSAQYCDEVDGLVGFDDEESDKVPYVEANWTKNANIAEEALEEIEKLFSEFDCQYQKLIQTTLKQTQTKSDSEEEKNTNSNSSGSSKRPRLKIYSPSGILETMSYCDSLGHNGEGEVVSKNYGYHPTLEKVKSKVDEVVKKYGPLVET